MSKLNKPSIDEHISQLDLNKRPSRDLWKGIDYAIQRQASESRASEDSKQDSMHNGITTLQSKNRRTPFFAVAASICVVSVVAYISFQSGKTISGQEIVEQISTQHTLQKQALLSSFEGQATVTQNWQEQLTELDEAAVAIKKALENEPNNAALLRMLKRVHQQQIALIERVHAPAWQQI